MPTPSAWLGAVTFDFTGTLVWSPRRGQIYSEVLARHGVEITPARADELVRQVWRELDCSAHPGRDRFAAHPGGARGWWRRFVERLCEHHGAPPPGPFAAAELFDRFARPDAWELYPEVESVLAELRGGGLRLGLISNWDERLPRLLEGLGLAARLDVAVHSQQVGVEKPHGRIFAAAVERLGLPAARILHVGDRRRQDVEGAVAAGLHGLWLDRGGGGGIADLSELPPWIGTARW